jgi:heterodisulfide reductase subunit B
VKVSYYPGCALHGTALEYDESTKAVSQMLGVELCELPDWNCCGASSAHVTDESLALSLAARNLAIAQEQGMDLVIPCAACYSRFKAAEKEVAEGGGGASPKQNFRVFNLLEFIVTSGLVEKIRALQKRSLNGLKVVCYYGCLLVRPPKVTGAKNFENPEEMDRLMTLLGAEAIPWSYKTDCCGGSLVLSRTDIVRRLTQKLFDKALQAGAEAIIVACPLCQSNLDSRQEEISREAGKNYDLPVLYFTELIGLAMGHRDAGKWFKRHFVDPRKLLTSKGLN